MPNWVVHHPGRDDAPGGGTLAALERAPPPCGDRLDLQQQGLSVPVPLRRVVQHDKLVQVLDVEGRGSQAHLALRLPVRLQALGHILDRPAGVPLALDLSMLQFVDLSPFIFRYPAARQAVVINDN